MGLLVTIILGAFVGWIASIVMNRDAEQGILLNIVVGVVGAFLGGFIASLFGRDSGLEFDLGSLFWSFAGAVALLAVVNQVQHGRLR